MGKRKSLTSIRRHAKARRDLLSRTDACHNHHSCDENDNDVCSVPTYCEYGDDDDDDDNSYSASEKAECNRDDLDDNQKEFEFVTSNPDRDTGDPSYCNHSLDNSVDNEVHDDSVPAYWEYDDNNDDVSSYTAGEFECSHNFDDGPKELECDYNPNCGESEEGDDNSSDDGGGDDYDNVMENVEMAMLTDTTSIDVDKDLVIRLLAVLKPLKTFLSSRLGGGYSESKQGNCALRLCNMLVWTALNSKQKKILDETTLLPWMEEVLKLEYTSIDSYCQYLEETKLYAASTIRAYLYDYG